MLLKNLRERVLRSNLELVERGLVLYTFGNASAIDRQQGLVAIKPSGVPYEALTAEHIVVTDLLGTVLEGGLRPSSDLQTHLEIYKHFQHVEGVVHTHSEFATAWAQAGRPIPCLGTTHADYFYGDVPVTRDLTESEIAHDYERNTGLVIGETMNIGESNSPENMRAVLVAGHAPFCWGASVEEAVHVAVVLEYVARMACHTFSITTEASPVSKFLLDKHFLRKHGKNAYYGQGAAK